MRPVYKRMSVKLRAELQKVDFSGFTDELYSETLFTTNMCLNHGEIDSLPVAKCVKDLITRFIPENILAEWLSKSLLIILKKQKMNCHKSEIYKANGFAEILRNQIHKNSPRFSKPKVVYLTKEVADKYAVLPVAYKFETEDIVCKELIPKLKLNSDVVKAEINAIPNVGTWKDGNSKTIRYSENAIAEIHKFAAELGVKKSKALSYLINIAVNKINERYG